MPGDNEISAALLKKVASKDRNAFTQLYELHVKRVRYFAFRRGIKTDDILDELCQDIFLKIWNKAPLFDDTKGSALSWIAAMSQNVVYDYWRKMQRTPIGEQFEEKPELEATAHSQSRSQANQLETWLVLDKALTKLKEDERKLFAMVYIQGLTMQQCAESLGIPNGTIKWRMNKIQDTLRSEVSK